MDRTMLARRIEEASLNAWPCLQQILYDGWILRFAQGHTKRANSVNALWSSALEVETKIAFCEACYRQRTLPTIFRITPFVQPADLDRILADRGYTQIDPTAVMYLDLASGAQVCAGLVPAAAAGLRHEGLDRWLDIFDRLNSDPHLPHRHGHRSVPEAHHDILCAIPGERFLASLTLNGDVVACGLGVLEEMYVGVFDLIVDSHYRNRGHGTALMQGMLGWAHEHGARHAYLQVMLSNGPARGLYEKLGFMELYRYWYRICTG